MPKGQKTLYLGEIRLSINFELTFSAMKVEVAHFYAKHCNEKNSS